MSIFFYNFLGSFKMAKNFAFCFLHLHLNISPKRLTIFFILNCIFGNLILTLALVVWLLDSFVFRLNTLTAIGWAPFFT
jgi:hypothetical protein